MSFIEHNDQTLNGVVDYAPFVPFKYDKIPLSLYGTFKHPDLLHRHPAAVSSRRANLPVDPQELYEEHHSGIDGYAEWTPYEALRDNIQIMVNTKPVRAGIIGAVENVNYPLGFPLANNETEFVQNTNVPFVDPINQPGTLGFEFGEQILKPQIQPSAHNSQDWIPKSHWGTIFGALALVLVLTRE